MLVYTKSRVALPSFLFTVGTVTGVVVIFLTFLRLTSFFLAFYISLVHGLHEGHARITPRLLVGLPGLRGLTCCCLEGITVAVIATAVEGVVGLEGTAEGFATLAELLTVTLLRDSTSRAARRLALWITLGFGWGCTTLSFCFALSFAPCFSTMTCSMALRSGSNIGVDLGTIEWLRLYSFCHDIGTDNSTMAARSASPKGIFPFFVVSTALELSFNVGRCLT
jgi:hypothetical protein